MNNIFVLAQNGTSLQQVMARVRVMGLVGPLKVLSRASLQAIVDHYILKVLNHTSRTLPRFPYTNLKKSRPEKKLVTEHA